MITIFLAFILICSKTLAENQPYYVIKEEIFLTPERERVLNSLMKSMQQFLDCFELEEQCVDCQQILKIFSAPMQDDRIKKSWRKWEKQQKRFTLLEPEIISLDKSEQAEFQYFDNLEKSFKTLKQKHPVVKNVCAEQTMGKTIEFHLFTKFKEAAERRVSLIVEAESYKHPLNEDLFAFKKALSSATRTPEGEKLIAKYREEQKDTLTMLQDGIYSERHAKRHDRVTATLIKELAMLDPASKNFYEKHVLHTNSSTPVYDFELIDKAITETLFAYKIGKIRKINDAWEITK